MVKFKLLFIVIIIISTFIVTSKGSLYIDLHIPSRKLTWTRAAEDCRNLSTPSSLWSPSSKDEGSELKSVLEETNWTSYWASIKKTHFDKFQWVNGEEEEFQSGVLQPDRCVALIAGSSGHAGNTSLSCWSRGVGAVCQADSCSDLKEETLNSSHSQCFSWFNTSLQWHRAQQLCRDYGSNLAVVRDNSAFRLVFPKNLKLRYYWIGLRNTDWTQKAHDGFRASNLQYWANGEPNQAFHCVVTKKIDGKWHLFTENCARQHHFFCKGDEAVDASTFGMWDMNISTTSADTHPDSSSGLISLAFHKTTSSSGSDDTSATWTPVKIVIIASVCSFLCIVLTILAAICIHKRTQHQNIKKILQRQGNSQDMLPLQRQDSTRAGSSCGCQEVQPTDVFPPPTKPLPVLPSCTTPPADCPTSIAPDPRNDTGRCHTHAVSERSSNIYEGANFFQDEEVLALIVSMVKQKMKGYLTMNREKRRSVIQATTRNVVEDYIDPTGYAPMKRDQFATQFQEPLGKGSTSAIQQLNDEHLYEELTGDSKQSAREQETTEEIKNALMGLLTDQKNVSNQ